MPNYFLDTYSYYAKIIPSIINQGLILGIGEQTVDFRLHLENYLSIITVTSCKLIKPAPRRLIFQFYVIKNEARGVLKGIDEQWGARGQILRPRIN